MTQHGTSLEWDKKLDLRLGAPGRVKVSLEVREKERASLLETAERAQLGSEVPLNATGVYLMLGATSVRK